MHTVDFRVLDDLPIRGRYSPSLTLGARSTSPSELDDWTALDDNLEDVPEGCSQSFPQMWRYLWTTRAGLEELVR
jgi:hypothetical protein